MHHHRKPSDTFPATYEEAVGFLYDALPMYQREGRAAYRADLDNTLRLDAHTGHPHRRFRSVHVAGTNGKGSVSHMLAAILQRAGYRTGLYTSPHLLDFRERIRIDGKPVPTGEVIQFIRRNKRAIVEIRPSFFEMTVAMAFDYFASEKVEIALIETGLGGRLDSTNILTPELSVITNISLDHTEFLGNSIEAIALEKAGIIKENIPVVIGRASPAVESVFRAVAAEKEAPLHMAGLAYKPLSPSPGPGRLVTWSFRNSPGRSTMKIRTDLAGHYQGENLATALGAVDVLRGQGWELPEKIVWDALGRVSELTGMMGRWQILARDPLVICDTAHNAAGVEATMQQVLRVPCSRLHIIWGMVGDKDPAAILPLLPEQASFYFTRSSVPRSMPEDRLQEEAGRAGLSGSSYPTVPEAYRAALDSASENDFIFAGGSTFVVADLLGSGFF